VTTTPRSCPAGRTRAPSERDVWRQWFVLVTAGEFVGFSAPALVGASSTGWPQAWAVLALGIAGAVEGAVLGLAQAVVL
jgi:hypothetical protein